MGVWTVQTHLHAALKNSFDNLKKVIDKLSRQNFLYQRKVKQVVNALKIICIKDLSFATMKYIHFHIKT